MKTITPFLTTILLLTSFAGHAAFVKMGSGMTLLSVDSAKTDAETRRGIELAPGSYELVVRYATVDDRKGDIKRFSSKPQTIAIDVGNIDLHIGVPGHYAKPDTAAYHFANEPEFIIKEKK
ncbi:DUF2057 domain-containing protein [Alginatibacterium sediminis]|uniref:DUF2057 domain-containing protein n=1 Tax=Alginatibacterium sediminis TaxID=2164068 RepID=A0A420E6A4_9ALTE|nr:DUF2057 family protein [Alginatibacterium sediminis]RKF12779.1 DUF2057 domain-containing protein [Alginatibacterium sediminis]